MNNETMQSNEIPNAPEKVLTIIAATYPFLSNQEAQKYYDEVSKISVENEVQAIQQMLDSLHNPHTQFRKVRPENEKGQPLSEKNQPKVEINQGVLIFTIPSWNKKIDTKILAESLAEHGDSALGFIIDVRDNGGGSDKPAFEFAENFIQKGTYSFGTFVKRAPEEGLLNLPAEINSKNENPFNQPVIILTSGKCFSACELFIAAMKASTNCTIIGEETEGGSAFSEEYIIEIDGQDYSIKIPTRRLFLTGQDVPLEDSKIKPDIEYKESNIIDFAINHILTTH